MRAGPAEGTTHAPHRSRRVCRVQLVAFWQRFDRLSTASHRGRPLGYSLREQNAPSSMTTPPPPHPVRFCTNLSEFGTPQIDLGSISRFGVETLRHRLHPQNFGPLTKPRPRPPKLPAGQIRCWQWTEQRSCERTLFICQLFFWCPFLVFLRPATAALLPQPEREALRRAAWHRGAADEPPHRSRTHEPA